MTDLYSNCVILEFTAPVTRAQISEIESRLNNPLSKGNISLPKLRQPPVCGEREANCVVPTIAADEC